MQRITWGWLLEPSSAVPKDDGDDMLLSRGIGRIVSELIWRLLVISPGKSPRSASWLLARPPPSIREARIPLRPYSQALVWLYCEYG